MKLVTSRSGVLKNVARLQGYLKTSGFDRDFAIDLIRNGICFVVTEQDGKPFFAPSRFVGYLDNTRHAHGHNEDKDGRETNATIEAIVKSPPIQSEILEHEYDQYCTALGVQVRKAPFGIARKFWNLR